MRLAQKLILYALVVALLPVTATGFSLIHLGEGALRERIKEHQRAAAVAVAAKVSQAVEELAKRLSTVMEVIDVPRLSNAERRGMTRMLYRQADDVSVAVLLAPNGTPLAPPVFLDNPAVAAELAKHPAAGAEDAARLLANLPLDRIQETGTVLISPVYFPPPGAAARVAVAVPCCADAQGRPQAVAGVELALRNSVLRVEGIDTGPSSSVFVIDPQGRIIAHPSLTVGAPHVEHGAVAAFLAEGRAGTSEYLVGRVPHMAAFAPVGALGWGVVAEQPRAAAYRAVDEMRRQTLGWILATLVLVLGGGLLFAGRLRNVLAQLTAGARAFGEGRLRRRVEVKSKDELGELGTTMNTMAAQLEKSLGELEAWSRTLEARVQTRTRELQSAQAQLLTQSKLAALGQLGAGVAHEINNPLAGILGLVQLLMRDQQEGGPVHTRLRDIEGAAKRCKEIVMRLLRFSEKRLLGRSAVQPNTVIGEVLDILDESLRAANIRVERELAADLPVIVADPAQLAQVLINIVSNARAAMTEGGRLVVTSARHAGGVHISITDNGVGIEPDHLPRIFDPFFTTKRTWTDVGLGLSVAHRIVSDHGGNIQVDSKVGKGSTFTVVLPLQPPAEVEVEEPPAHKVVLLE